MSYEIVKSIQIRDGKVFIKSDSNNVWPRDYHFNESSYLTKILQEQGQKALDLDLLHAYEDGCYQPGVKNKYSKAIERLKTFPEYKNFDWRVPFGEEYDKINENRKKQEFDDLLWKAFTEKYTQKFIVLRKWDNTYLLRINRNCIKFTRDKQKAKKFIGKEIPERVISSIINVDKNEYEIIDIN